MSNMKQFAIWLAQCVHKRKMTDAQIIEAAKKAWNVTDEAWVKEQIDIVNANPEYIKLAQQE